jgi:citrate/tricarballylate utilization protein
MPSRASLAEAERQMVVCNACRYCEGFCAVFPAMARRRVFADADLTYLANLCHDCRGCLYACQYAPPHEFEINVPRIFAQLRRETYEDLTWPRAFGRLFRKNGLTLGLTTSAAVVLALLLAFARQGPDLMTAVHTGEGAFYRVVPYWAMVLPASALALFALAVLAIGGVRFWRQSGGGSIRPAALGRATLDALTLTYLGGGGQGCNYPQERFSYTRRWFHHLVFYGFLLDFASTSVAAFYDHVLHHPAPYPILSLPVLLGTVGGVLLVVGTLGLLVLKGRSDRDPTDRGLVEMDVAFLVLLLLTSLSGLILLALRETSAMGTLLVLHLGIVAGLFITLPYGKLVHAVYRYLALVRYALETRSRGLGQTLS